MKHQKSKDESGGQGDNVLMSNIDEVSAVEPTSEILDLTRRLLELESRYDEEKKKLSELYDQKSKLEISLYDRMKDIGIDQFRTAEFGLISTANRLWGKITDMTLAEEWLKENGLYDEVLKVAPIKARVNEILKKRLEEGQSIPPGFDYSLSRTIHHRSS